MKNKKTFYITTPIYYPSGNLHLGHLFTTTICWVIRNYKKKQGYDTFFLTGSDEHGQKIAQKAAEQNLSPDSYVQLMSEKFQSLWKLYQIDYDFFSRTTSKEHQQTVQNVFSTLFNQQQIYLDQYQGLYSISDEEFVSKNKAVKNGEDFYHPTSGHKLKLLSEKSYFLNLKPYVKWWNSYLDDHQNFIRPPKVITELKNGFLKEELEDLSISRDSFSWGVPVLENSQHVIYVWLDALINYISALGYKNNYPNKFDKYWTNGDEIAHIIGKEIIRFHCLYWPMLLEALNLKQPTVIQAHGWIITNSGKMSKSKDNVIDPLKLAQKYDVEIIKYFLVKQFNFNHDTFFDEAKIKEMYNADLANNFGNLISRTIALLIQNFPDRKIKHNPSTLKIDQLFKEKVLDLKEQYIVAMDKFDLALGLKTVMELADFANKYIDNTKPWLLKNDKERLSQIIDLLLNSIYALGVMLEVVLPQKINLLKTILNLSELSVYEINNWKKFDNHQIEKNEIIFPRW